MTEALEDHTGTVSIGGQIITNLRLADNTDRLAGSEQELEELVTRIDRTSSKYEMEINTEKMKLLFSGDNSAPDINTALALLRQIWKIKNISMKSKIRLQHALVFSIFLYTCEIWTLTV